MYRVPKWWRRFKRQMLFTDLMTGRKVIRQVNTPDGSYSFIEVVDKPMPPLNPDEVVRAEPA